MLAAKPYHMTQHWDEAEKQLLWREPGKFESTIERLRDRYRQSSHAHQPIDQVQQIYCGDWLTEDLLMKADKMSMATSLEVREPFLDHHLAEWAAKLPLPGASEIPRQAISRKRILRDFCRAPFAAQHSRSAEAGLPGARIWLARQRPGSWAEDLLFGPGSRIGRTFATGTGAASFASAQRGRRPAAHKVWVLIVLEHWLQSLDMTAVFLSYAFPPQAAPRAVQVARLAKYSSLPIRVVCAGHRACEAAL